MKNGDVVEVKYNLWDDSQETYLIEVKSILNNSVQGKCLKDARYLYKDEDTNFPLSKIDSIVPAKRPTPVPVDGMKVFPKSGGAVLTRINGLWYKPAFKNDNDILEALESGSMLVKND